MKRRAFAAVVGLALAACDPPDEVLAVIGMVPPTLQSPDIRATLDANGHLRWEARNLSPPEPGQYLVMWLANASWQPQGWVRLGAISIHDDRTGSGAFLPSAALLPSFEEESRPLAITLETSPKPGSPSDLALHWTGAFPRHGEPPRSFAYGNALAASRLEDLLSPTGSLNDPVRGFARFEIFYPRDVVKVRLWNFKTPFKAHRYVVWAYDGATHLPLATIDQLPELNPTPLEEIPAFRPSPNEFSLELPYDETQMPYGSLTHLMITYDLVRSAPLAPIAAPAGVAVLTAEALGHDLTGGGASGDGHNH